MGQSRRFCHVGGMSGFPGDIGNADTREMPTPDMNRALGESVANPYKSTTT
jgi:hypothetical protein